MSSGPVELVAAGAPTHLLVDQQHAAPNLYYQNVAHRLVEPKRVAIHSQRSSCAEVEIEQGGRLRIWFYVEGIELIGYDAEGGPVWRVAAARCAHETQLPADAQVDGFPQRSEQS